MSDTYKVGQVIELNDGRSGVVQFVGQTSFSAGDWIGVVLEDATGKNDGSVQGQRYFDCDPGHGMFLRPSGVSSILQEAPAKPAPKPKAATATATKTSTTTAATRAARPGSIVSNGLKKSGVSDPSATKRQSINAASPTPAARTTGVNGTRSPAKPGVRPTSTTVGTASSRGATPSVVNKRASMAPASKPTTTTTRPSVSSTTRPAPASSTTAARTARVSTAGAATTRGGRVGSTTVASTRGAATQPTRSARVSSTTTTRQVNGVTKSHPPAPRQAPQDDEQQLPQEDGAAEQEEESQENAPDPTTSGMNGNFAPPQPKEKAPAESEADTAEEEQQTPESPSAVKDPVRLSQRGAPTTRHIQDLEAKLRMLEKRREEDKEKLLSLEKMQGEKERLESIIQKMQSKLQPQSQELTELRKQLKESQSKLDETETGHADHETSLEEAYLDREMAEEVAEAAKAELEAVKQKLEELQLEVEVLREENEELGGEMSPEERSSQGWLQMERSNERLREALVRLRDMTQDTEAELREEISSLEDDLKQLKGVKDQYDEAREKLRESETAVESLKEQLDDALGSEQTIEEFATQNESLKGQIDELKMAIQDLEDIKELNDELEVNHVEAEKQMQDELDYKDSLIVDHRRLAVDQQEKLIDHEYTITKFRELVTNLQSHLEDMKASQQLTEAEAEELSSRSKAMTDLNLRLQTSAARTQMNTVDLELRRLEAQEAVEHLAIVQMFLPESYQTEKDSVLAYLRFIRLAAKSRILHQTLKNKLANDSNSPTTDNAFAVCDILDKLVWIASMCDRFVSRISASTLEEFSRFEAALHELDPVERGLNGYIDAAKKDDLRAPAIAEELQRTEALMSHLAEVHIHGDNLADYAEDVLMRTTLMQSYLENIATATSLAIHVVAPNGIQDIDDEEDSIAMLVSSSNALVAQSRSAKVVAGKALAALQDLKARSMSTTPDNVSAFEECQEACASLAGLTQQLGTHIRQALATEEPSEDNPVSSIVRNALSTFCAEKLPDTTSHNPLTVFTSRLRSIASQLNHIHDVATSVGATQEFTRPDAPWAQRAAQLATSKAATQSTEAELSRLRDTLSSQGAQLRQRDTTLEEATVKIELLESRTRDANAKANRITELSRALDAAKARERDLAAAIEAHARDTAALSAERDRWRALADERLAHAPTGPGGTSAGGAAGPAPHDDPRAQVADSGAPSARDLDALRAQVASLAGAVRFLRADNARARLARPTATHTSWLSTPLSTPLVAAGADTQRAERASAARDARAALARLRDAVRDAAPVDLAPLAGADGVDRLRWRPAREKGAWRVAALEEAWGAWRAQGAAAVVRARDALRAPAGGAASAGLSVGGGAVGLPLGGRADGGLVADESPVQGDVLVEVEAEA